MERTVIMGAAGRDFHDFLTVFKGDQDYKVVAFTAAPGQNLGEAGEEERGFPSSLAGELYEKDIPIIPQKNLEKIIEEKDVDTVVLSYSDLSHEYVMHQASRAIAAGADFKLLGSEKVMLESDKPVVAIDAVRTGCGKSQTSRKVASILKRLGKKVVIVREPMPYGNLEEQEVMRFEEIRDLDKHNATIEEREEYEQHIREGHTVYAGVNYRKILEKAEEEADVILWDGGNNELPFFKPDLHFVLADPHRPGDELKYHPGESNLRMADYAIINKENTAKKEKIDKVEKNVKEVNPEAEIIHADSVVKVDKPQKIEGKKVLVVEDGPTLTHGGTSYGAGTVAAEKHDARPVDPRPYAVGSINRTFEEYKQLGNVLPAMGYSDEQIQELEETINKAECDAVILGTPADLRNVLDVEKPVLRVSYDLEEKNKELNEILEGLA
ncbi:MAG: cyclic 2,3-diphosphoglycerate synthase [Candidatus Nanohaloarchaeota archaeon QJJ-9]|nr:cyclic 2,3-diphosphoglycerate synthase [Candidatus Nanohaloarchaeota archaeon QJJ-9]